MDADPLSAAMPGRPAGADSAAAAAAEAAATEIDPPAVNAAAVVALRPAMLRFAQLQLQQSDMAEDLVQEALEQALRQLHTFTRRSSLKTWVFTILRNRVIDYFRTARRELPLSNVGSQEQDWQDKVDTLFAQNGSWQPTARPASWPSPHSALASKRFWTVFEFCVDKLPSNQGRAFLMREFLGLETAEICAQLGVTENNCFVLLHRARLRLRECVETGWGKPGDTE